MNSIETLRKRCDDPNWRTHYTSTIVPNDALRKVLAFVEAYAASGHVPRLPKNLRLLFEEILKDG